MMMHPLQRSKRRAEAEGVTANQKIGAESNQEALSEE